VGDLYRAAPSPAEPEDAHTIALARGARIHDRAGGGRVLATVTEPLGARWVADVDEAWAEVRITTAHIVVHGYARLADREYGAVGGGGGGVGAGDVHLEAGTCLHAWPDGPVVGVVRYPRGGALEETAVAGWWSVELDGPWPLRAAVRAADRDAPTTAPPASAPPRAASGTRPHLVGCEPTERWRH
jgi:hypothetical protein